MDDDESNAPTSTPPACSDGVNNDGDASTDWPLDTGCSNPFDADEAPNPACSDGADNDGNGRTDWNANPPLADSGCLDLYDASETG